MIFLAFFYKISEKAEFWMDLGVRGSQIISEKLPIFNSEGYRVGSSPARGHHACLFGIGGQGRGLSRGKSQATSNLHLALQIGKPTGGSRVLAGARLVNSGRHSPAQLRHDWIILNNIEFLHNFSENLRKFLKILPNCWTCHLFLIFLSTFAKFRQNFIKIWLRNSSFDEKFDWIMVQFNIQFRKIVDDFLQKKLSLERCKRMSIL